MSKESAKHHPDARVIDKLGGPAVVARMLGFDTPKGTRRVHNWKNPKRGIPEVIRLRRQDIFGPVPTQEARDVA